MFDISVVHFYTPLLLVETVGVEGLQNACHLSQSRTIALTPFHAIPPFLQNLQYLFVCKSVWGLPLGMSPCAVAFQVTLGFVSSHILKRYLNHHKHANYL